MSKSLGYYQSLITSEYQSSVKWMQFLTAFLNKLVDVNTCADGLVENFDLDQAVGVQLDLLGEIIGISRTLPFQPSGGISPILTDTIYRLLLKATVGRNQWDGQQDSLQSLWTTLFPNSIIAIHDNHAMNMDVFFYFPDITAIFTDIIRHGYVVPKPEAVRAKYYIVPPKPLFGFGYDDPYVSGFGKGNWYAGNTHSPLPAFGFGADNTKISGFGKGYWWYIIWADGRRW